MSSYTETVAKLNAALSETLEFLRRSQVVHQRFTVITHWILDEDPCGSYCMYSDHHPLVIYCTPFWEDTDGIAISVMMTGGDEIYNEVLPFLEGQAHKEWWQNEASVYHPNHFQWQYFTGIMQDNINRILKCATTAMNTHKPL